MQIPLPTGGVDLLSDETQLPAGYVRRAENVDIARSGVFSRREGYALQDSAVSYHSLFAGSRGVLVAKGAEVFALNPSTLGLAPKCDMGSDAPVDVVEYNGATYLTSRSAFWWIPADSGTARKVGVEPPNPLPSVAAHDAGNLTPGKYAVAISRVDDRGEESAAKFLGIVETNAGIRLDGMPLESGAIYRVYLSPNAGDVLYLADEFAAAFATYKLGELPEGAPRTTQHLAPMPAGEFVRWHGGRLYTAAGDTLAYSEPLRPHLTDPRRGFIKFVGRITFFEPVTGGIFVGDNRGVWFLPGGDPKDFTLRLVSPEPAVFRSSLTLASLHLPRALQLAEQRCAVWLSTAGYMVGTADGSVIPLHPDRVRLAAGLEGRSRFVVRKGVKQVITLVAANGSAYGVALDSIIQ